MISERSWARWNGWQWYARRWPKPGRGRRRAHQGGSPMLLVSDIQSSQEELQEYYAQLAAQHVTPAWIGGGISVEPRSEALPYLWHWRESRPPGVGGGVQGGPRPGGPRGFRRRHPTLARGGSETPFATPPTAGSGGEWPRHRHFAG